MQRGHNPDLAEVTESLPQKAERNGWKGGVAVIRRIG
jgi:hypothetical protein